MYGSYDQSRLLQPCGEFFSWALPIPFGNFYPLAPHPLGISIDHCVGGGGWGYGQFLESHIQYIKFILVEFLEKKYPQSHSCVRKWVRPQSRTPLVLYSYSWCQVTSVLYIEWGTLAGLQITAGQRTMSGQILRWPDNLCGCLRW